MTQHLAGLYQRLSFSRSETAHHGAMFPLEPSKLLCIEHCEMRCALPHSRSNGCNLPDAMRTARKLIALMICLAYHRTRADRLRDLSAACPPANDNDIAPIRSIPNGLRTKSAPKKTALSICSASETCAGRLLAPQNAGRKLRFVRHSCVAQQHRSCAGKMAIAKPTLVPHRAAGIGDSAVKTQSEIIGRSARWDR